MQYKDYYEVLGVSRTATQQEIQKAYRSLARKYHPDVNQEAAAEDRFKEISEANEVLSDTDKRSRYDQVGSEWNQARSSGNAQGFDDFFHGFTGGGRGAGPGGRRAGGGTVRDFEFSNQGFSSFFEELFGGAGRGAPRGWSSSGSGPQGAGGAYSRAGENVEATITLTLEEAAKGGQREVAVSDPQSGRLKKLRVNLPAGLKPAQKIRLAGQGGGGLGGGRQGDLYLHVDLAPHREFKLKNYDLHVDLPVSPWQAALGHDVSVPTLNGPLTVRIPAGTSSGRKIRLRGKGYPRAKGGAGDLFAKVSIVVPSELSEREKELFEQLAAESNFEPGAAS